MKRPMGVGMDITGVWFRREERFAREPADDTGWTGEQEPTPQSGADSWREG